MNKVKRIDKLVLIVIFLISIANIYLSLRNEFYGGIINFLWARKYRIIISLFTPIYCIINLFIGNQDKKINKILNFTLATALSIKLLRKLMMIYNGFNQFGIVELLEDRYDIVLLIYNLILIVTLLFDKIRISKKFTLISSLCVIIYIGIYCLSYFSLVMNSIISLTDCILLIIYNMIPVIEYTLLLYYLYNTKH